MQLQGVNTPLPEFTTGFVSHPEVVEFLMKYNSWEAYRLGLTRIEYDPKSDRVLFYLPDQLGAVGRALSGDVKPKWKNFGDTSGLYHVGSSTTAIIVEDACSACAVGATLKYAGVALLGTNLTDAVKLALGRKYTKCVIALDADASAKGLKLAQTLDNVVSTTTLLLPNDLKYYSADEIISLVDKPKGND